jgi:hypothetical protein
MGNQSPENKPQLSNPPSNNQDSTPPGSSVNSLIQLLSNEALLEDWASLPAAQRLRVRLFVRRLDWALARLTKGPHDDATDLAPSSGYRPFHSVMDDDLSLDRPKPEELDIIGSDEEFSMTSKYGRTMSRILSSGSFPHDRPSLKKYNLPSGHQL